MIKYEENKMREYIYKLACLTLLDITQENGGSQMKKALWNLQNTR